MTATSLQRPSCFFFYHLNPLIKITKGNLQKTLISHDLLQCPRRIRPFAYSGICTLRIPYVQEIGKGFSHWVWSNVCLGYVHTILVSLSRCHKKLSGLGWTPIRYVTLHLSDQRGAASLRHRNRAEITVLMCKQKPYPVWFCAGAKAPGGEGLRIWKGWGCSSEILN